MFIFPRDFVHCFTYIITFTLWGRFHYYVLLRDDKTNGQSWFSDQHFLAPNPSFKIERFYSVTENGGVTKFYKYVAYYSEFLKVDIVLVYSLVQCVQPWFFFPSHYLEQFLRGHFNAYTTVSLWGVFLFWKYFSFPLMIELLFQFRICVDSRLSFQSHILPFSCTSAL